MIPRAWKSLVKAPRGKILVERDPIQSMRHGLHLTQNYLDHTKTATGTVYDIHADSDPGYCVGDHVLLSASGGVQIVFGFGALDGESELWLFGENAVKCIFEEVPESVEQTPEHIFRHERHRQALAATTDDGRHVEGETEALR